MSPAPGCTWYPTERASPGRAAPVRDDLTARVGDNGPEVEAGCIATVAKSSSRSAGPATVAPGAVSAVPGQLRWHDGTAPEGRSHTFPRRHFPAGQKRPPSFTVSRILIVEDDPVALAILARLLESRGHEVHACADAESVETARRERGGEFPLVMLDLFLPGRTGFDFP